MTPETYKNIERKAIALAQYDAMMPLIGDYIAKEEGYKNLSGVDAIHFYLIHTFHWKPSDVYAMKNEDIRLILSQYLKDWTLPPEYR